MTHNYIFIKLLVLLAVSFVLVFVQNLSFKNQNFSLFTTHLKNIVLKCTGPSGYLSCQENCGLVWAICTLVKWEK